MIGAGSHLYSRSKSGAAFSMSHWLQARYYSLRVAL